MNKNIGVAVLCILLLLSCSKKSGTSTGTGTGTTTTYTPDCSGTAKSFAADVNPLIQTNCATNSDCHASGSTNGPGQLLTFTQIFNARSQIRSAVATGLMPKNNTLSPAQKNNILCWIDQGAINN